MTKHAPINHASTPNQPEESTLNAMYLNPAEKLAPASHITPAMQEVLAIQQELAKTYPQALSMNLSVDPLRMQKKELFRYMEEVRADYEGERAYWNQGGAQMEQVRAEAFHLDFHSHQCRLYYPYGRELQAPAIFYLHGGGYIVGSNNTHDRIMRDLADRTKAVVIGVEYSLSPESKLPRAFLEVEELFLWTSHMGGFQDIAAEFGIDASRLAFAGDSCGATLILGGIYGFFDGEYFDWNGSYIGNPPVPIPRHPVRGILLYYGGYGLADHGASDSMKHSEGSSDSPDQSRQPDQLAPQPDAPNQPKGSALDGMRSEDLELYRKLASPRDKQGNLITAPSRFENILAVDFRRIPFPPACIVAADQDPLLADSIALAEKYQKAGIRHEYHCYTGVLHAFLHYQSMLPEAQEALQKGADFLKALWN